MRRSPGELHRRFTVANISDMTPAQARAVLKERVRRANLRFPPWIRDMHQKQLAFWEDRSRFKVALAGRRGGKTQVDVRGLLDAANRKPEAVAAYLGVTREVARRLAWAPLQRIAKKYGIPMKFNRTELTGYHENGAEIWILGADREDDIDKILGPAYSRFISDESASYRSFIKKLITEAVEPALADFRGDVWLTGSPGYSCSGFYYDASTNQPGHEKWSVHHWTVLDNPFFPDAEGFLAETRRENGWAENHPIYRRQWLGQWVHDESALVYKYNPAVNDCERPPHPIEEHTLALSIDFGVVDPCAFGIWAFHPHDPCVYCLETSEHHDMSPTDCAQKIHILRETWGQIARRPADIAFETIVGDTPGIGKAFSQEAAKHHGVWITPAEKRHKWAFISLMNGELQAGRIKVVPEQCQTLISNWQTLPWKEKDGKKTDRYDDRKYDDHSADMALYGWRHCRGYAHEPAPPPLPRTLEGREALEERQGIERLLDIRRQEREELELFEQENYGYSIDDDVNQDTAADDPSWFIL